MLVYNLTYLNLCVMIHRNLSVAPKNSPNNNNTNAVCYEHSFNEKQELP